MLTKNVAKITTPIKFSFIDYPEPESTTILVYFYGCEHNCEDCQNKDLQDYNDNNIQELDSNDLYKEIIMASIKHRTINVVLTGGDPLYSKNIETTKEILLLNNENLNFCIFTGYDIDYVKSNNVKNFKYIKTGRYIKNLKQKSSKTNVSYSLASSNQKLYNHDLELLTQSGIYIF